MRRKIIRGWLGAGLALLMAVAVGLYLFRDRPVADHGAKEVGGGRAVDHSKVADEGISISRVREVRQSGDAEGLVRSIKASLKDGISVDESARLISLLGDLFRISPKDAFYLIENEPLLVSRKSIAMESLRRAILSGAVDSATLGDWIQTTRLDQVVVDHALESMVESPCGFTDIKGLIDVAKRRGLPINLGPLFGALYRKDPSASLDLVRVLEGGGEDAVSLGSIKSAIADAIAETSCSDAYRYLVREKARYSNVVEIVARWVEQSPKEVAKELPDMAPDTLLSLVGSTNFFGLIRDHLEDSNVLVDRLMLNPATKNNSDLLLTAVGKIAKVDSGMACRLASSFENGALRNDAIRGAFATISENHPESAMTMISSLESASDRQSAYRGVASIMAARDFDAAVALAAAAPASCQVDIYREIARTSAHQKPENALTFLEDPKLSGVIGQQFRADMLDHTVRSWAKTDLVEARTWVEKLPATDLPMGVQGLMNPWMKSDPVAASEWLSALPPGAARDAGARVVIDQVKDTDPEMAEQWRKSLSQPAGGKK